MSKNNSESTGNSIGRPKKGEGPRIPYSELDRILVFGEVVECDDGKGTTVVYAPGGHLRTGYTRPDD